MRPAYLVYFYFYGFEAGSPKVFLSRESAEKYGLKIGQEAIAKTFNSYTEMEHWFHSPQPDWDLPGRVIIEEIEIEN